MVIEINAVVYTVNLLSIQPKRITSDSAATRATADYALEMFNVEDIERKKSAICIAN